GHAVSRTAHPPGPAAPAGTGRRQPRPERLRPAQPIRHHPPAQPASGLRPRDPLLPRRAPLAPGGAHRTDRPAYADKENGPGRRRELAAPPGVPCPRSHKPSSEVRKLRVLQFAIDGPPRINRKLQIANHLRIGLLHLVLGAHITG